MNSASFHIVISPSQQAQFYIWCEKPLSHKLDQSNANPIHYCFALNHHLILEARRFVTSQYSESIRVRDRANFKRKLHIPL